MNSTNTDAAIFVTKYSDTCNLFVKTKDYKGIVVTREGKFLGLALNPQTMIFDKTDYTGHRISAKLDTRKAIQDFLGKNEPSLTVSPYTGDEEHRGCFYVAYPNEFGRVINYKTQEHMGFAQSSTSEITNKYSSDHPCMKAIKKLLSDRKGSLCENGVTVMHYDADERYNHHVFVMIRALCFVVDLKTRQVVGYVFNSEGKVLEKEVDKTFFDGLSYAADFYSVVDSFLSGKRDPEHRTEALRKNLQPFKKTYFKHKDQGNVMPAIGKIVTTIDDKVMAEIREIYPEASDGKSIMAAMEELF